MTFPKTLLKCSVWNIASYRSEARTYTKGKLSYVVLENDGKKVDRQSNKRRDTRKIEEEIFTAKRFGAQNINCMGSGRRTQYCSKLK